MIDLAVAVRAFQAKLDRARHQIAPRDFEWYRYASLAAIPPIESMLSSLPDEVRSLPMLDLGCADGDLAFFFESLGYQVTAVDHELTNHNQMRGVRALKEALGSKISIHTADLDGRFHIPGGPFGLCLLLGILYHLKNPFYMLEYVAQKARYCVLSTRVARRTPRGAVMDEPLAYLVDADELNQDRTNFWIFSPEALKRLVTRAGWTIRAFHTTGATHDSDPVSRDERAWCLLESRVRAGSRVRLGHGWHDLEEGTYRWTEPSFSIRLLQPAKKIRFRFTSIHPLTLSAENCSSQPYAEPGEHVYAVDLPDNFAGDLHFRVDPALHAAGDDRPLGVLVSFWREGVETSDDNAPIDVL